ncbi:hypothetical protein RVR_8494 [Actinacidiphila reveromycinica]|uniref:Uncharacterized protein n=1 Tax=Actinacidiphila reveromycinica TaxID=659352 RepID=A0A7U3UZ16_9ACTN|nr:DUF6343 family protein [Streptomyces sp. SN-593]BBB01209.1 hypothetical protein RVR_8494 [Streptomyces sp. SN-593]
MSRTSGTTRTGGTPGAPGPPGHVRTSRTGYEPTKARSALRLRLTLALLGVVWGAGAAVGCAYADRPGWAAVCALIALVALVDVFVVRYRMRQGTRYQPGRDEPPVPPADARPGPRPRSGGGARR